jgi:hypothetical protein
MEYRLIIPEPEIYNMKLKKILQEITVDAATSDENAIQIVNSEISKKKGK